MEAISGKKRLRIQKYPDTCGQGRKLPSMLDSTSSSLQANYKDKDAGETEKNLTELGLLSKTITNLNKHGVFAVNL